MKRLIFCLPLLGACSLFVSLLDAPSCDEASFVASCDGNILVTCDEGIERREDCGAFVCSAANESCGVCGDGIRNEANEVCDDGNNADGDGCRADCQGTEACGDGLFDPAAGEACDDANLIDADGCEADCSLPACQNNIADPGELCHEALPTITVNAGPISAFLVDIDKDGDIDISTANDSTGDVSLLLNNGTGTFSGPTNFSAGGGVGVRDIVAGDIDKDGDIDLLASRPFGAAIAVLLNNNNDFSTNAPFAVVVDVNNTPTNCSAVQLSLADLDADLDLDLVVTCTNESFVALFHNDGTGGFSFVGPVIDGGNKPGASAVGDLNGDGRLDIVFSSELSSQVRVALQNTDGTFPATPNVIDAASNTFTPKLLDFDADGDLDITVVIVGLNRVDFFLNDGQGQFTRSPISAAVGATPLSLALGDFDGDGTIDVVTGDRDGPSDSVALRASDGGFAAPVSFPSGLFFAFAAGVAAGDLNNDGVDDFVSANAGSSNVGIFLSAP